MPAVMTRPGDSLLAHARAGGIVIMAGAGVSSAPPSSLPGWKTLNGMIASRLGERLESYLRKPGLTQDLRQVIDARRDRDQFPPDYQSQILEEQCGEHYFHALKSLDVDIRNPVHDRIAWLARHGVVRAVVTTNFDRLIEYAMDAQGVQHVDAYDPEGYEKCLATLQDGSRHDASAPVPVLKVHGCVRDHQSLVDTLKQRLLGRNEKLDGCLDFLLAHHAWLMVGFSASDLETDDEYLRFVPGAARCPGLTYVQWPGSPKLTAGATRLMEAYRGKAELQVVESDLCLAALGQALELPAMPAAPVASAGPSAAERVAASLSEWAAALTPAATANSLATVAEASGEARAAFDLLHVYWRRVDPGDRDGDDFTAYRLHHGRLGMGQGLLSLVDDRNERGEESLQNLLRVGHAQRDPRARAWAGIALLWAGQTDMALPLISEAGDALEGDLQPEHRGDVSFVLGQALYLIGEPEGYFETWRANARRVEAAGDLPRHARLAGLAALYCAEFDTDQYLEFMAGPVGRIAERVKRLHDPGIDGFFQLALARYHVKTKDGPAAVKDLGVALRLFESAGMLPWQLFTRIEYAKALLDQNDPRGASEVLQAVEKMVDRYQLLLIWFCEAAGQFNYCVGLYDEARKAFEQAIQFATKAKLTRRADALRNYLPTLSAPPGSATGA